MPAYEYAVEPAYRFPLFDFILTPHTVERSVFAFASGNPRGVFKSQLLLVLASRLSITKQYGHHQFSYLLLGADRNYLSSPGESHGTLSPSPPPESERDS